MANDTQTTEPKVIPFVSKAIREVRRQAVERVKQAGIFSTAPAKPKELADE